MARIVGIDHVAITLSDMEASCAFCRSLFDAQPVNEYAPAGKVLVRQLAMGGAPIFFRDPDGNLLELMAADPG
ncbi:conserved protein of unknown function [Rhodovastum atsumiense]|uniref:VOC domain-containing protein n=1 Tax=Rhodovastum atsumiense TaxID=504468 RepID=A0A5M6IPZ7_9PROT|nr:hypothetical protein [Rhodovastum atsumiense]KAA5610326.1 hypothetical protein F1189_19645 [Rhodovastum atsumiense]CAH2600935.1 conserved protein of unknown function [Rhodovastum atsumiense]